MSRTKSIPRLSAWGTAEQHRNVTNELTDAIILRGTFLESISLGPLESVRVNHLLGRPFLGWIVVRLDAAAAIYEDVPTTVTTVPSQEVWLRANTDCQVSLWVF